MKFDEIDVALSHEFIQVLSSTPKLQEFFLRHDTDEKNWEKIFKILKSLTKKQLKFLELALAENFTIADIVQGGGATEVLVKTAGIKAILSNAKILYFTAFESQTEDLKKRFSSLFSEKIFEKITISVTPVFLENLLKTKISDASVLLYLGISEDFHFSSRWMEILAEKRDAVNKGIPFWMILRKKMTGFAPEDVEEEIKQDIDEIFRSYQMSLEKLKIFDRISMLKLLNKFQQLKPQEFADNFSKYDLILVDHANRYLPEEFEYLKLFLKDEGSLAGCGDFSNTFYRPSAVKGAKTLSINETFRHSPFVVDLMKNLSGRQVLPVKPIDDIGIFYYEAVDETDEMEFIAFSTQKLIKDGVPPSGIGVIFKEANFPQKFIPVCIEFGVNALEYPGAGTVVPFTRELISLLEANLNAETMELLSSKLDMVKFKSVKDWFERKLKRFAPFDSRQTRNKSLLEDLKRIKERSGESIKLVTDYFAPAYSFEVVFIPSFTSRHYTESFKTIFYRNVSRSARGIFITRPLVIRPTVYYDRFFKTEASPLLKYLPAGSYKRVQTFLKKLAEAIGF